MASSAKLYAFFGVLSLVCLVSCKTSVTPKRNSRFLAASSTESNGLYVKLTSGRCPLKLQVSKEDCLAAAKSVGAKNWKTQLDGGSDSGLRGRPHGCTLHNWGNVEWWGQSDNAECGHWNYNCVCKREDLGTSTTTTAPTPAPTAAPPAPTPGLERCTKHSFWKVNCDWMKVRYPTRSCSDFEQFYQFDCQGCSSCDAATTTTVTTTTTNTTTTVTATTTAAPTPVPTPWFERCPKHSLWKINCDEMKVRYPTRSCSDYEQFYRFDCQGCSSCDA